MRAILRLFGWLVGYGWLYGRRRKRVPAHADAGTTMDVIPLPRPTPVDDDIEGKTVRAPMSHEEAYELHARYSPSFDQQAALHRYVEEHGDEAIPEAVPEHDPPGFNQHRYANALQYADAFEAQLARQRRTAAYQVAPPRRVARGSYTPQQYTGQQPRIANEWDEPKTQLGVHPIKK